MNILYETKDELIIGKPVKVDRGMVTIAVAGTENDKRTIRIEDITPVPPIRK